MKKFWHRFLWRSSWRAIYEDGKRSVRMEYGVAKNYVEIFGGAVVFDPAP